MTQKLLLILLTLGVAVGCSSSDGKLATYRTEAKAYCSAHTPEYWINSGKLEKLNSMRPTEKAQALIKEFRLSVTSTEMATLIFDTGGKIPAEEFYPFLQKEIPKLTKQPFNCPSIPEFYLSK